MKRKINMDGIISFFMVAALVWFDYELYYANTIPFKWRIITITLATIIVLLCVVFTFKKLPHWGQWIRRTICFILVVALSFASFNIAKVGSFTKRVTDVKDATENISIVVKNDSGIKNIKTLKNEKVGIQTGIDSSNSKYAQKLLDKAVTGIDYIKDDSYINLANSLLNDEISALIISNSYITSIEDSLEGFSSRISKIKTYERTLKNKSSSVIGNNLDLNKENFSILISGMDETGKPNHNSRSDVNMVLLVNPTTKYISMISLPRDSYVPNPALNNGNDKLTHTGNDGVENTMKAIENVLGFNLDFYVKVNFTSVVEIVDAIGGINITSPIAFCEQDSERNFENEQCLKVGKQYVNGEKALAFARHRHSYTDIDRTKAQQEVLSGMINKLLTTEGITKVPALLDIVPKYVVTSIGNQQLDNFISYQLEHITPWSIENITLENGINASLTTASMGNTPLSCHVLNRYDVEKVYKKYQIMFNPITFNKFQFDLSNLEESVDTPPLKENIHVSFSDDNLAKYQAEEETAPVEKDKPVEEPIKEPELPPVTPPIEEEDPTTPPVDPTIPPVDPITPPVDPIVPPVVTP